MRPAAPCGEGIITATKERASVALAAMGLSIGRHPPADAAHRRRGAPAVRCEGAERRHAVGDG
jgi:hypothetical protein